MNQSDPEYPSRLPDEIQANEELLRRTTEMAGVAVWEYDFLRDAMVRSANHDALYGMPWQPLWQVNTFLDATHPEDREMSDMTIEACLAPGGGDTYQFDFRVIWPDQSVHWLWVCGQVVRRDSYGRGTLLRGVIADVTQRKILEAHLDRSLRLYSTLSECNQAVIHSSSEAEMLERVCAAPVDHQFAAAAWIGMLDVDGNLEPVASKGDGIHDFLQRRIALLQNVTNRDFDLPQWAIEEDRPVWRQKDFAIDADPFTREALQFGWVSATSIPIRSKGTPVAALTLYASIPETFDTELDSLLHEMAGDISFALDGMRRRYGESKNSEALRIAIDQLHDILDQAIIGIFVIQDGRIAYINESAVASFGLDSANRMLGQSMETFLPAAQLPSWRRQVEKSRNNPGMPVDLRIDIVQPDGTTVPVSMTARQSNYNGRSAQIVMLHFVN